MAQTSTRQRKTTGRIMHEFAHGELKSGPRGKGGKVKSRRQAIAIALMRQARERFVAAMFEEVHLFVHADSGASRLLDRPHLNSN
jgi:hypothetical protein